MIKSTALELAPSMAQQLHNQELKVRDISSRVQTASNHLAKAERELEKDKKERLGLANRLETVRLKDRMDVDGEPASSETQGKERMDVDGDVQNENADDGEEEDESSLLHKIEALDRSIRKREDTVKAKESDREKRKLQLREGRKVLGDYQLRKLQIQSLSTLTPIPTIDTVATYYF